MSAPAPHHPRGGFSLPSFGLAPAAPLQVHAPLSPTQTVEISLPLSTAGSVMKTEPLNSLQVRPGEDQAPQSLPTCRGRTGEALGAWLALSQGCVCGVLFLGTEGWGWKTGGQLGDGHSFWGSGNLLSCAHRRRGFLGPQWASGKRDDLGPPLFPGGRKEQHRRLLLQHLVPASYPLCGGREDG